MKIIEIASKFIGEKELAGNRFTDDTELGKILHEAGQRDGEPWCAYFAEAICKQAYPDKSKELQNLFSASAVQTFKNFVEADYAVTAVPRKGALVVWRKYVNGIPQRQGHIGIVAEVLPTSFKSIEGNSNAKGSRDADSVVANTRVEQYNDNGLSIMGFITLGYEPIA